MNIGGYSLKRLRASFECQRERGKSSAQIVLELLSRLAISRHWATKLAEASLARHGLGNETRLADVLIDSETTAQVLERGSTGAPGLLSDPANEEVWVSYRRGFSDKIQSVIENADRICRHEFNLLGAKFSYGGRPIDWHIDPVSGYRWPKKLYSEIKGAARTPPGTDIKIPWELSRMQHLPTLGKAYRLTQDERYAREVVEQLTHWLDDNPCPYGVNWTCAMDAAIRIMNIVWAYLSIKDAAPVTDAFKSRLAIAIFQHGQYIRFNLEYGLRGDGSIANSNHFLSNIVGLLHLGFLCSEIKAAETWKTIGISGLIEEMDRQVLPDGVNYESSTSYHRLVLELFTAGALLCRLSGVTLPDRFWERLERMYEFALFAIRPDGTMPLVGDADDGRLYILSDYGTWHPTDFRYLLSLGAVLFRRSDMKAQFAEDAFWWLGPSTVETYRDLPDETNRLGSKAFPEAGLYVLRAADSYLLACCGQGVEGAAAHKHNDLLSFELWAGGKAFIVDPGAYVYTRDLEWRNLFRSTAYHNTVVIDSQEQNRFDPKQIFKMTLDANVIVHDWRSTPDQDRLDVEHTGYRRLTPPVSHRRTFVFNKRERTWEIVDMLIGEDDHTADWYLHFDAGIALTSTGKNVVQTRTQGTNLEITLASESPLDITIEDGWISRQYGYKIPAQVLHMSGKFTSQCRTRLLMRLV